MTMNAQASAGASPRPATTSTTAISAGDVTNSAGTNSTPNTASRRISRASGGSPQRRAALSTPPSSSPSAQAASSQPARSRLPASSLNAAVATVTAPSVTPTSTPTASTGATVGAPRAALQPWCSRGVGRQAREGGATAKAAAPSSPTSDVTCSTASASATAMVTATRSGPATKISACAPASSS